MSLTPSTMLPLGTKAPDFELPDPQGNRWQLSQFQDARGLVIVFMCNHCPFVKRLKVALAAFARECRAQKLAIIAINANDANQHREDSPGQMAAEALRAGYTFPYLIDSDQSVAKAYRAACTPDFFLFDQRHRLVYRGQFDDSRPGNDLPVTGRDLRAAVARLLQGKAISPRQKPSLGCNIKWRPGNAPDYWQPPAGSPL